MSAMLFVVGMILGAWIGVTLLSCCLLAKRADNAMENNCNQEATRSAGLA